MISDIANQTAWSLGRDKPKESDFVYAYAFFDRYSKHRIELNLSPVLLDETDVPEEFRPH